MGGYRFIGEESAGNEGEGQLTDGPTWMIDPIDGTTNFIHRCGGMENGTTNKTVPF